MVAKSGRQITDSDLSLRCKFYVYRHTDRASNIPVYIGIGTTNNVHNTVSSDYKRALSFSKKSRSIEYANDYSADDIIFQIIYQSDDLISVKNKEKEFVLLYGRRELGTGSLYNKTVGGDSLSEKVMYASNNITKSCESCGKDFKCIKSRENVCKYCSKSCSDVGATKGFNSFCSNCGKPLKRKPNEVLRNKNLYCSSKCLGEYKSANSIGIVNPNYGNRFHLNPMYKGDLIIKSYNGQRSNFIFVDGHPNQGKDGRILLSKKVVEDNFLLFDSKFFYNLNGKAYLSEDVIIHHNNRDKMDCNIENLNLFFKNEYLVFVVNNKLFGKKRGVRTFNGNKFHTIFARTKIGTFNNEDEAYDCYFNKFKETYGYAPW